MFNKQYILDLFKRQWDRVEKEDIRRIIQDTGGISAFECAMMYVLILDRAPRWMIEFSPNHGYSTQAMAMACRVLGIKGRFGTFEIKPALCDKTRNRMKAAGLHEYVEVVQGDALKNIPEWIGKHQAKVDFVFIDSDHTEGFANKYIANIFPLFQTGCLLGVHDICAHKRDDSGQTAFKTSLGKGSKHAGEEKPIDRHLKGKKFCVLHAITGGKHEQANLPNNDPFYNEIRDITSFDFRKAKGKPCPKTVFFMNSVKAAAVPPKPTIATPESKGDQHLFILGMNDSGTTFLQNVLSHCENCVSFRHKKKRPHGMEGQGVSYWKKKQKGWYPRDIDHGVVKIFSEKADVWIAASNKWNWKEIKASWNEAWRENDHYGKADPKIFLEKTPSSLFSVPMYESNFPGCKFLIMHRNPYVVCEGIRRTVKQHKKRDYTLRRCAEHWVACSRQQMHNIERLCKSGQAIWFKYEDMVTKPGLVQERITKFVPALYDLDIKKPSQCHSLDGNKAQALTNYNNKQLKRLTPEEYAEINDVLEQNKDIMEFFGYTIRSKAP